MNYARIASRFYTTPWMVREDWHRNTSQVLRPYLLGQATPNFAQPYLDRSGGIPMTDVSEGFALIRVEGAIGRHLDLFEAMCGGYDLATLENQIQLIEAREDIHTVIISFNTPGGLAVGVREMAGMLEALGQIKRTVAWLDYDASSAGYYLASACNEIYALPSAYAGSVSTLLAILDESRAFEMAGYEMQIFTDGDLKDIGVRGTSLSDKQRVFLQDRLENVGSEFKSFVSRRRPAILPESMQGGFYSGEEAMERGFVDGLYTNLADLLAGLIDNGASV